MSKENLKFIALAILTTALIFGVFYGMIAQIDEKLQARFPETTETVTEAETDPIEYETIETESETDANTICEDTDVALSADDAEIQPLLSSVSEPAYEAVTEGAVLEEPIQPIVPYTEPAEDDVMLLARLIMNEAGYDFCSDAHQRAVASVLLNHVASPYFPDNIHDCIFVGWYDGGRKHYGIESPEKFYSREVTQRAIDNARYVLTYGSTVGDAIYQAEYIPPGHELVASFIYPGTESLPTYICR